MKYYIGLKYKSVTGSLLSPSLVGRQLIYMLSQQEGGAR